MGYQGGDPIPFVIAKDASALVPALMVKRVSDGYYLDFNDNAFKNAGWTTKSVSLQDKATSWEYVWDTTGISPSTKVNALPELQLDGEWYPDDVIPIGYGAGGGGWDDLEADHQAAGSFGLAVSGIKANATTAATQATAAATAVAHGTYGLSALKTLIDALQADLDDPDQFKADVSGLATAAALARVEAAFRDPMRVLRLLVDHATGAVPISDGTEVWASSDDPVLTPSVDYAVRRSGAASLRLVVDLQGALGKTATLDLGQGRELDLSGASGLSVWLKSQGAGDFLAVGLSEDGVSWTEWAIVVAEADIDTWVQASLDLSTFWPRAAVRYARIRVTSATPDQQGLPGDQLWPQDPGTNRYLNVWLDRVDATRTDSLTVSNLLAVADQFKADVSGLATRTDAADLLAYVKTARDLTRILRDWSADRILLDTFDDGGWVSEDDQALQVQVVHDEAAFGGSALRIFAATPSAAVNKAVSRTYRAGLEKDLSACDGLRLSILSPGYGSFLSIGLSLDGTTWSNFAVTIAAADAGRWVEKSVTITGMASRAAVKAIRFRVTVTPTGGDQGDPLWPQEPAQLLLHFDRFEARKITALLPAPAWA